MPLYLLLPIVVLGILGIALLLHLLGNSKRFSMVDAGQVNELWQRQFPNARVSSVDISDTRHQALVETSDGPGVVWAMGADVACRLIGDGAVQDTGTGLKVWLGDYSAPVIYITLNDRTTRKQWVATLTGA